MAEGTNTGGTAGMTCLGCGTMAAIGVVFVTVLTQGSVLAAFFVLGVLMLAWFGVAIHVSSKRSAAREAERQARWAQEQAEHAAHMAARAAAELARYTSLVERFGESAANGILAHRYWQGATMPMMYESLGVPADVREKVYKSKTKTTHCYRPLDARRYELKVHFEDGIVVGWDD